MDSSGWKTAERSDPAHRPLTRRGPPPSPPLFSPSSQAEHGRIGKRLWWSLPAALAVLGLLVLLGPSAEEVDSKFTIYGKDGPLRIMPEIAIDDGQDAVQHQMRRQVTPPSGAPQYEVLPEDPLPQEKTPPPRQAEAQALRSEQDEDTESDEDSPLAEIGDGDRTADLLLPSQQADSDFIIRKLVRPLYPVGASLEDRQKPRILVEAAFYLDQTGAIVAVMIESNEGGPAFADAVRLAMEQWEFEPRWRDGQPPAPRWLRVPWRFRSPFTPIAE